MREARNLTRARIEVFCKEYATLPTDIALKFKILDESTQLPSSKTESSLDADTIGTSDYDDEEDEEPTDEEIEKAYNLYLLPHGHLSYQLCRTSSLYCFEFKVVN